MDGRCCAGDATAGFGVRRLAAAVRWSGFLAARLVATFGASTETGGSEFALWATAASNGTSSTISTAIALTPQRARNFNIGRIPDAGSTTGFSDAHRRR